MNRNFWGTCSAVMLSGMLAAFTGCGGGSPTGQADQSNGATGAATAQGGEGANAAGTPAPSPIPANHVLVGNWKGNLIATPEQLKQMQSDSISLELEFGATGEMAMLATMSNAAGTQESAGIATWSIAGHDGNRYTIQSRESETEMQELVIEMLDTNTMVVDAAEGGQFKLQRFVPPPPAPSTTGGAQANVARAPTGISPPPVQSTIPAPVEGISAPPVQVQP